MLVDKVEVQQNLPNTEFGKMIRHEMSKLSERGLHGRAVFNFNEFLKTLADIDFDEYSPREVSKLIAILGESLASGLSTAANESNRQLEKLKRK